MTKQEMLKKLKPIVNTINAQYKTTTSKEAKVDDVVRVLDPPEDSEVVYQKVYVSKHGNIEHVTSTSEDFATFLPTPNFEILWVRQEGFTLEASRGGNFYSLPLKAKQVKHALDAALQEAKDFYNRKAEEHGRSAKPSWVAGIIAPRKKRVAA
jgi:hypothetical protein